MAISAYIGIPGSGKSYEAVCNVIIPAFTSGRRVVTNIYGLQKDKITERYPDATGEIIVVDNDDVLKADFFPFKGGEGSFCQFGDLIVIDEAWRINGNEKQTDKRQSIWNSGKVRFFLVLFPLMFIGSGWLIYSFFSTFGRSDPSPDLATTDVRDAAMFRSSAATPAPDTPSEPAEPSLSTEWRISGRMTSEGRAFVILVNGALATIGILFNDTSFWRIFSA
ncbi:zonular occludens toxin domain-containing protein [Yersinia enterocolitica]